MLRARDTTPRLGQHAGRFLRTLDPETIPAAVAAACLVILVLCGLARARSPFELGYTEGNVLSAGVRVANGLTPYPDSAIFPYALNPYGPVGYLLTAAAVRTTGVSLFAPRLLVLVAGVLCALVAAGVTRRSGGRWRIGLVTGVLFLSAPLVRTWFPVLRVDLWAILFSLLGLYAFLAWPRAWFAVSAFFALAVLTKPTAVAAPLACAVELLLRRKTARAVTALVTVAGVFLTCGLYLGNSFWFHLFRTHPEPYSLSRALELYYSGLTSCFLAVAVVLYAAALGCRWTPATRVCWLYLGACSVTAFTAGNLGSDTNHLLEWLAAVCLVAGLALGWLFERRDPLAHLFTLGLTLITVFWTWQALRSPTGRADRYACADAYAFIASFPSDRVLSEDVAALILAGKPVLVSDPYLMTQLGASVYWSQGGMEQLVARKYFDLIVLGGTIETYMPESRRWPRALMEAVRENYRLVRRWNCAPCLGAAYLPKASANTRQ